MKASEIIQLLATKHAEDVFVPECKDGPTWSGAGHVRLDAWAMRRSWKNMSMTGYEVKVSRSDFVADNKWPAYLPLCNSLYFVAPVGLIKPEELPGEVGLLVASTNSARLMTKKKAAWRDIEPPEALLLYIIMCRSLIGKDMDEARSNEWKLRQWKEWLAVKDENRKLGWDVARKIREHVEMVERRNDLLETQAKRVDEVKAEIDRLGFGGCKMAWDVKHRAKELQEAVPEALVHSLESAQRELSNALRSLEKIRGEVRGVE